MHRELGILQLEGEDQEVWTKVRIQGKTYHNLDIVTETHTIFAESPHDLWKYGRYDCAIINIDPEFRWPRSSLEGILYHFKLHSVEYHVNSLSTRSLCCYCETYIHSKAAEEAQAALCRHG